MDLKKLSLWGWIKLLVGLAGTAGSAVAEAGGHLPHGVSVGIATATAVVMAVDKSAGLKAAATSVEAQTVVDKAVAQRATMGQVRR